MLNLTYNEMLSAYSTYPAPIRPYLLRGETHPVLREKLTKSLMRAFIDLVSRANIADPARPIQVRMDLTAERLGISSKTVSRTIKLMKKNGWLTTNPGHDGRNWLGEYAGREFILSDALRKLVGLPTSTEGRAPPSNADFKLNGSGGELSTVSRPPASQACSQAVPSAAHSTMQALDEGKSTAAGMDNLDSEETKMSDGQPGYPHESAQEFSNKTGMSDGHIGVNNCFIKKEAPFKTEALVIANEGTKSIRIPADLADMHTVFGISGKGICGLMRMAKDRCQRLQDIWKVKKEQLRKAGATGGRAVLYLRSLLLSDEDFAYVARSMPSNPAEEASPPVHASDSTIDEAPAYDACNAPEIGDRVDPRDFPKLYDFAKTCVFKKFKHVSNGMVVRFYEGTADVSHGSTYAVYAGWAMMRGLYLGVYRGNLVEVSE
jgi:hypothetical protein